MTFNDLVFEDRRHLAGVQAHAFFPNGYGASIVRGFGTYGAEAGLYELAVLKGTEKGSPLCYDTPITDDVLGHLTPKDVTRHLLAIEALPKADVAA